MKVEKIKNSENTETIKISELSAEQQEKVKNMFDKKSIDNIPLTYEILALNFEEDKETPHFNVYPSGMYRTDKYFIGAELNGGCDCQKHLTVVNYENNFEAEIRDGERSIVKSWRKFTIGDLKSLLRLVGLNEIANNIKIEYE